MVSLDCQLSGRCAAAIAGHQAHQSGVAHCGHSATSHPGHLGVGAVVAYSAALFPITSVRSGYFAFCPTPLSTAWRRRRRCWDRSVRRPGYGGWFPIMIDWSDLGQGRNGLFAAVCFRGRGLPLLSWVSTPEELNPSQNRVEEFLHRPAVATLAHQHPAPAAGGPGLRAGQSDPFGAADAQPHRPSPWTT